MADSEAEPTAWELMRTLRTIAEDVRYVRENSATREALRDLRTEMRDGLNSLGAEVAEESKARQVADEKAKTERLAMIEAEASVRHKADEDERRAREKAVEDEQSAREKAIEKEEAARKEADNDLKQRVDKIWAGLKYGGSAVLAIVGPILVWLVTRGG